MPGDPTMGDQQAALGIKDMNVRSGQGGHDAGPRPGGIYNLLGFNQKFLPGQSVLKAGGQNIIAALFKSNDLAEG